MSPLRIHEREPIVRTAENELTSALHVIVERHALTAGEALRLVSSVSSHYIGGVAKYWIREERHGNRDTPGGLVSDKHRNGCGDPKCKGCDP